MVRNNISFFTGFMIHLCHKSQHCLSQQTNLFITSVNIQILNRRKDGALFVRNTLIISTKPTSSCIGINDLMYVVIYAKHIKETDEELKKEDI